MSAISTTILRAACRWSAKRTSSVPTRLGSRRTNTMLEFVGALAVGLISPGATVPLLALSSGVTIVRTVRTRIRNRNAPHPDPAASANGAAGLAGSKETSVTISWGSVNCTFTDPKSPVTPKRILQNAAGVARPGRILAILGPSGSGKTTLLNSIAGQVPFSKKLTLTGNVVCNGEARRPPMAYVTQEDLFFSQLSVEETLQFATRMRLPSEGATPEERKEFVDTLIRKLGLETTKTTRVGKTGGGGGISGGERKRLSLGCELISTPKLIICDEP